MKTMSFKGKQFFVEKGGVHPEYSYFTFEQEENDFRNTYWNISENDIVIDIGTSYGAYALTACAMGATVYAFEPEKTVYCDLVNNININNWEQRCFASNNGLWSSEKKVDMKGYAPHWPQQTISEDYSMKSLDQIVKENNISKIDWIKIDVEGAEEHVVSGALETIKKFKPKMIIECHVFLNADIKDNVKKIIASAADYVFEEVSRPPCVMLVSK
jgi:FkbM family methyltransferase